MRWPAVPLQTEAVHTQRGLPKDLCCANRRNGQSRRSSRRFFWGWHIVGAVHVLLALIFGAAYSCTGCARRSSCACSGPRCASMCWRSPSPKTDRKSTRLNSSHLVISYAVFCLKKKKMLGIGCVVSKGQTDLIAIMACISGVTARVYQL